MGDPRRERPPAVCGHFVNVPTHFKVKLPVISGHLPNADADSHLLVVSTCYNGQCKQMPRFRWSFQPKIAGAHPNLRPTDLSCHGLPMYFLINKGSEDTIYHIDNILTIVYFVLLSVWTCFERIYINCCFVSLFCQLCGCVKLYSCIHVTFAVSFRSYR